MPRNAPMAHVIILVAEPLAAGAEQVAADIAAAFAVSPVSARTLSPDRAVELVLDGAVEDAPALTTALREALPETDVAVVPQEGRRKRVLCADMDATMVVGETLDELAAAFGKGEAVAAITERAMRGELDFEAALDERVAMLAGQEGRAVDAVAASLTYSPGAGVLVRTMAAHGARCVLVSGGFDRVTGTVREALGFDLDRANHLEETDGVLTGRVRKPIVDSTTKTEVLAAAAANVGVDLKACLTIGDGANDRPMIEAAGMGIAYRGKPTLKAATQFWIDHTDLRTALYYQGYADDEIT